MTLRVSGKNMNIGDALRAHVVQRLDQAAAKYFDGAVSGQVTITPEGSGYRADCNLHLSSGAELHADGRGHEPYATFDQAAERIAKRLRRYHSRLKSHHGHASDGAHEVATSYVIEAPDQEQEAPEQFSPAIIAESTTRLRRLSVADAVLDLDMTGAAFVVFRHAQSGRVNVVHRRVDGHVGWIDPPPGE